MELSLGGNTISATPISQSARLEKEVKRLADVTRTDGSSVFAEVTTTHVVVRGKPQSSAALVIREPVVGPGGRFIEATVNLRVTKPGIAWVFLAENGTLQLTRHAVDKGFVLFYDMCHGRIKDIEASVDSWETWEAVRKMRFHGQRADHGALPIERWAHPEIIRRRKKVRNGIEFLGSSEMEAELAKIKGAADSMPAEQRATLEARAREEFEGYDG